MLKAFASGVVVGAVLMVSGACYMGGEFLMQVGARLAAAQTPYEWAAKPIRPLVSEESNYVLADSNTEPMAPTNRRKGK